MTNNADYTDRLLYRQSYTVPENTTVVVTAMYAVSWRYQQSISLTVTRIRLSLAYEMTNGVVIPSQGLIEQWKSDGWIPVDEYLDENLEFDSYIEYENFVMRMVKSFLIGIPIEVTGTPRSAPPKTTMSKMKFKKVKRIPKNEKEESETEEVAPVAPLEEEEAIDDDTLPEDVDQDEEPDSEDWI